MNAVKMKMKKGYHGSTERRRRQLECFGGATRSAGAAAVHSVARRAPVGRCKWKSVETRVESAWLQRSKVTCDIQLSNFAFNFNLRCYAPPVSARRRRPRRGGSHGGGGRAFRHYFSPVGSSSHSPPVSP